MIPAVVTMVTKWLLMVTMVTKWWISKYKVVEEFGNRTNLYSLDNIVSDPYPTEGFVLKH